MVFLNGTGPEELDDEMMPPHTVPSAGFTPPPTTLCDYSHFAADHFDLSLLPGEDTAAPTPPLAVPIPAIYLEVPPPFTTYRTATSPDLSLYTPSPASSIYSHSPLATDHFLMVPKEETLSTSGGPTSPSSIYSNLSSPCGYPEVIDLLESVALDQGPPPIQIKEEFDTGDIRLLFPEESALCTNNNGNKCGGKGPKENHQLLRQALRDTTFQRRYNIKPIDLTLVLNDIKMEEPDLDEGLDNNNNNNDNNEEDLMQEQIIEPVLNLAIEQMKRDVNCTCNALAISPDPLQWTSANVVSWLQWTSRQFALGDLINDRAQWEMPGTSLVQLSEEDFVRRSPQGGMILYAQLEVWKAAYSEQDFLKWPPPDNLNESSSGDGTEDDEESDPVIVGVVNPTSSSGGSTAAPLTSSPPPIRTNNNSTSNSNGGGGTHIHLWQFLKELLSAPQTYGSCIRWMDRTKGIFKIEDSVKVARLWGKRKNRPAMNYDKLSRSIRQYYKKGIMKKTERSQRLVYQFCHPYNN